MKAWRKACPQSLHRKGVCAAWPPFCRWPVEPGGQASLHSGLPRGAPSLQAAWGWKKPKVAGKTCPDVPHREGFSDRRTRQLSPSSRRASSSCSLRRQPSEPMSPKFSSITSRYRLFWVKLRRPHSSREKYTATSSKVTGPCASFAIGTEWRKVSAGSAEIRTRQPARAPGRLKTRSRFGRFSGDNSKSQQKGLMAEVTVRAKAR